VTEFRYHALKELADQQARFAPPARKQEQLVKAQKLLSEISPEKNYPYQFIAFRITDHRPDAYGDLIIPGSELKNDLQLFIRRLEKSIPALRVEEVIEPMLSLEEISKKFNVSTKTISRWRLRGLVGQRIIVNGRRQVAFAQSIIEQFLNDHQDRVERSARFSLLKEEEKEEILRRARRLALAGGTLTEVCRRIARRLDRSVEAVRYTIKNFDRANPDQALFAEQAGALSDQAKVEIYTEYTRGTPVDTLARQYGKTRTSMYRVINEVKAEKLLGQPVEYIHNPMFEDASNDAEFLAPMPNEVEFIETKQKMHAPKDVPADLASLYEWPLLTKDQEQHLFRKMNYLKYKLNKLRASIDAASVRVSELKKIEELDSQIKEVRDRLINCNMRLVVKHAKQHSATENLFELVSDGNISLMRAVEKFDYSRGNKFSTYASWAIIKNFARSIPDAKNQRERFLTGHDEVFEARPDNRGDESEALAYAELNKEFVSQLLADLDPRTRDVIRMRNGLDGTEEMTLEQIGQHFGITKERVRQINVRGMKLLREKVLTEKVVLP
jgi:RNA polymerase primary sigma factor